MVQREIHLNIEMYNAKSYINKIPQIFINNGKFYIRKGPRLFYQ